MGQAASFAAGNMAGIRRPSMRGISCRATAAFFAVGNRAANLIGLAFKGRQVLANGALARLNRAVRPEGCLLACVVRHRFVATTVWAACPAAGSAAKCGSEE